MVEKFFYILKNLRWPYFLTWYAFFLGYFVSGGSKAPSALLNIFLLSVAFGPIFYSGIYYLNDIFDRELDRKDPVKRNRPVASGKISLIQAYLIAVGFILEGVAAIFLLKPDFLPWLGVLLLINLFYTLVAKKVPYLELVVNVVPHLIRFYLGNLLAGTTQPHPLILMLVIFTFGLAIIRRLLQMNEGKHAARPTLRYYSKSQFIFLSRLAFFLMIFLTFWEGQNGWSLNLTFSLIYLLFLIAYNFSYRSSLKRIVLLAS